MTVGYTVQQVMARLGVSKAVVMNAIKRGDLHAQRYGSGRRLFVEPAEAEGFIQAVEAARASAPDPQRSRGSYCQSALGGRCFCACHANRRTKDRQRNKRTGWRAWLTVHDAAVRELAAAGNSPEQIAAAITARFSLERSAFAVRQRIRKLGISTRDGWVSGEDLIRTLGVYRRRVAQYEAQGLLRAAEYGSWRRYPLPMIEALIASQAGLTIDPRRVKDPRWRTLAETAAVVNRRRAIG